MNRPQSADGIAAWGVFEVLMGQLRIIAHPLSQPDGTVRILRIATGLHFSDAIHLAEKMGADNLLFVELLPEIEAIVVRRFNAANE